MVLWLSVKVVGKGMLYHLITKASILKKSFSDFPQLLRPLFGFYLLLPPLYTGPTPLIGLQPFPR